MQMAREFGIREYPAPAGGCLLTDKIFSNRLRDLLYVQKTDETRLLHLLKFGRHFRLDNGCKLIVGRSKDDNDKILHWYDKTRDIRLCHAEMAGPDVILLGSFSQAHIETAAQITAGYTRSKPGETAAIRVTEQGKETLLKILTPQPGTFEHLMI